MPRQDHNIQGLKGSRNDYSGANSARFNWTNADVVEGEQFDLSRGRAQEILMVRNTDSSPHTLTILTVEDPFGRKSDVVYNLPNRSFHAFGPFEPIGWRQPDGKLYFSADDATVQFAVLRVR